MQQQCKYNLNSPVFQNVFTHRTRKKYVLWNENAIHEPPCRTNFSQCCIWFLGLYHLKRIVISENLTLVTEFKCQLKHFTFYQLTLRLHQNTFKAKNNKCSYFRCDRLKNLLKIFYIIFVMLLPWRILHKSYCLLIWNNSYSI